MDNINNKEISANPIDFSIQGDMVACWNSLMRQREMDFECCIPAIVTGTWYDRNAHTVEVRPLVDMVSSSGETIRRPIMRVTYLRLVSGRYFMDSPLSKGDTGWIIASDRDSFLQKANNSSINVSKNNGASPPNTYELHKYRHGFFIPDSWARFNLSGFGSDFIIGDISEEGIPDNYITISRSKGGVIDIVSQKRMSIDTKVFRVKSKKTKIDSGSTEITGTLDVTGNASLKSQLEVSGIATMNGGALVKNKLTISTFGGASVDISPADLGKSNMKIRKVPVVEGFKLLNDNKTLRINMAYAYAICTDTEDKWPIEFTPPGDGSGGGGGGSSISTFGGIFRYDHDAHKVDSGYIMAARKFVALDSFDVKSGTRYLCIKINHPIGNSPLDKITAEWKELSSFPNNSSDEYTYFPIYLFNNFEIAIDYRGMPTLALYE